MLLEEDGLNAGWEHGIDVSDYLGDLGQHEGADSDRFVPLVFARAHNPRLYDQSGMGDGGDPDFSRGLSTQISPGETASSSSSSSGARLVRDMALIDFRKKLIEHFTILWRQRRIQWPSRNGGVEWKELI